MSARHARIEIAESKGGGWCWRLVASNSQTLAHSKTYTSKRNARRGAGAALFAMEDVLSQAWGGEEWVREVES